MKGGGGVVWSGIVTQPIFAGIVPVNSNFQSNRFPARVWGTPDLRTIACYGAAIWEIHWLTLVFSSQPIRERNNKPIH